MPTHSPQRTKKNRALLIILLALVACFYFLTIVKVGGA